MLRQEVKTDSSRLYVLGGVACLLALAVGGFAAAAVMHLRRRKEEDKENS